MPLHRFTCNGKHLIFDGHALALHEVDEVAWELLAGPAEDIEGRARALAGRFPREAIDEAVAEIRTLAHQGLLFAPDPYGGYEPPPPLVKALCLNVAHACNLSCGYCFAGGGEYGAGPAVMPPEIARRAVDFLIAASGPRKRVEIDFFGGEPLLALDTVRAAVAYAREREAAAGKEFGFTLTTNALLLTDEVIDYLLRHGFNVVLSLDGRPEVHNRFRRTRGGQGSYAAVRERILRFIERWENWDGPRGYYYVRGTFTRYNQDFAEDFLHLVDLGVRFISLEPAVGRGDEEWTIREEDLPRLEAEYERLARLYLALRVGGRDVHFFHFRLDLDGGPCLPRRLTGCGAGCGYLAVAPDGSLYPCHQFDGRDAFRLGDVWSGATEPRLVEDFRQAHIYRKPCRDCWAKFLCSGGCHAAAFIANGNVLTPYVVGCRLMQKRLECALYLASAECVRRSKKEKTEDKGGTWEVHGPGRLDMTISLC
ncbi:MAG: thioether cross-link-forming SCIFF peptide maturase [Bacillota bacterium]